jgi:hypothetical protein
MSTGFLPWGKAAGAWSWPLNLYLMPSWRVQVQLFLNLPAGVLTTFCKNVENWHAFHIATG